MATPLQAQHGEVCSLPRDTFGYFAWGTVARLDDGTLVVAASGLRHAHVCPFGRTVICRSRDDGKTWTWPRVVNDSPLDDRDAGLVCLGGEKLLLTWFTSDLRKFFKDSHPHVQLYRRAMADITDDLAGRFSGSWMRTSDDGGQSWSAPARISVTSPHGPIRLRHGDLLHLGKVHPGDTTRFYTGQGDVLAQRSADGGTTWQTLGTVPLYPGTRVGNYHEPHAVELPDGKLVGLIRFQDGHGFSPSKELGLTTFSLMQTESTDGGRTWSPARPLGFHGSPPHLLRHSTGVLVCSYGYRLQPFGQRVALSSDGGATWRHDYLLRDDGPTPDLGYPSSVELSDGSIFTVYYEQPLGATDKCALLWSRWNLPTNA